MFGEKQYNTTKMVITNSDEMALKSIITSIPTARLRKIIKMAMKSINNRSTVNDVFNSLCVICNIHAINAEDGETTCPSCLSE